MLIFGKKMGPEGEGAAPAGDAMAGTGLDLESVLSFDPFKDGMTGDDPPTQSAEPDAPAAPTEPAPSKPAAGQPQQPTAAPASAATPNPELTMFQQRVQQLESQLAAIQQARHAQPQAQPAPAAGPQVPPYQFNLPPQLQAMLNSEEPTERAQGLAIAMQGVAQAVHQNLMNEWTRREEELRNDYVPQTIHQYVSQQQKSQEIFQDFYGTYQDLAKPELRGLVMSAAQQVYAELGNPVGWSPQLRDTIATRVYQVLGKQPGQQQQPSTPPTILGGGGSGVGSRPNGVPNGASADIMNTLFGG